MPRTGFLVLNELLAPVADIVFIERALAILNVFVPGLVVRSVPRLLFEPKVPLSSIIEPI